MTLALAKYIGDNFTVVTHIETDDIVGSGFDATVWKQNSTGKIYVSFQGTTGAQDFLTDIPLAFTGNAGQQVIDMANWWLKITTPVGQMARQIGKQVDPVSGLVSAAPDVPRTGLLSASDLTRGVEVNGHSLGGYLATAFTRLFGSQAGVEHTSTFNSAGFAPGSEGAFANLQNLIGQSYGLGRFPIGDEQTNYYAANGLNVTTNDLYFNQAGERVGLNQEEGIGTANHSMYKLTDLLALGAAMENLTSRFRFGANQLNALVKAGSNQPESSIEGIFDALRKALEGPGITASSIGDAGDSAQPRVEFHAALAQFNKGHAGLASQLTIEASGGHVQSQARYDFAALVALQDLSPIVVRGVPPSLWQSTRAEDYAAWEADWYLPAPVAFTNSWIADRAAMLGYVLQANQQDIEGPLNIPGAVGMHYEDVASGKQIDIGLPGNVVEKRQTIFGDGAANTLAGKKLADHLYGGAGMDKLEGNGGDDYLEGGADADTLDGGAGTDTLAGGAGADIYRLKGDWGVDAIEDGDGLGTIEVNGQALTGGRLVSANAWESADKEWRYALTEQDELMITSVGQAGRIVVRGWSRMQGLQANPLGLDLNQPPPTPEPGMYALQGGQHAPDGEWQLQADGSVPGAQADYYRNDLMEGGQGSLQVPGTYERITGAAMGSDGALHHTVANTRAISFWGLGGNDFISGEQYGDCLDGGDGDDLIWGGAGSDMIVGGTGDDVIVTNMAAVYNVSVEKSAPPGYVRGADNVVTDASGDLHARWWVEKSEDGANLRIPRAYVKNPDAGYTYWPEGEDDRDTVDAGDGDDHVWGGRGADYLIGGWGADHLAGLGGDDMILGGYGRDVIYGDDWSGMRLAAVYDEDHASGSFLMDALPLDPALKSPALHGNDVIDAGEGDDEVWGDGGNDLISGGSGNDRLMGDALPADLPGEYHGNDKLDGGDGDDLLIGFGKDDVLLGGAGTDELQGDADDLAGEYHGNDNLDGGDGNDMLVGGGKDDVLTGDAGDDELQGDAADLAGQYHGNDELDGGDGSDRLFGMGGSDTLRGGVGDDIIEADDAVSALAAEFHGNDYVDGGEGNDNIAGGGGDDVLLGGGGDDWIAGEDELNVDSVSTLTGNDRISGGAGNDALVGGNGDDVLQGDDGDDWLYGGAGNDTLDGGSGQNVLKGGGGDDVYATDREGVHIIADAEGANVVQGVAGMALAASLDGDIIFSSEGRTVVLKEGLVGGFSGSMSVGGVDRSVEDYVVENLADPLSVVGHADGRRLLGGQAADEIFANGRGSTVRAGKGNDQITLNNAGASIVLNRGDGADRVIVATPPIPGMPIADKVGLQLGAGIVAQDVSFDYDGTNNLLNIRYSPEPGDVLQIMYGGMLPASVIDHPPIGEIRLADGSLLNLDLTARAADEDAAFDFEIPESAFADLGGGVSLAAMLADGQPLPQWLHFDGATRTFSGTPANGDVGNLSVQVVATKDQQAAATYGFALVVRNTNDAPEAGPVLETQEFTEGEYWAYNLPEATFKDVDAGDVLTYSAKLADGKPLPDWLKIDAATGSLSCIRGLATHLSLVVTATDLQGAATEQQLNLYVKSSIEASSSLHGVVGTPDDDVLVGSAGRDVLVGGLGNDTLDGGPGDDELIGGNRTASNGRASGTGQDTYLFGRGDGHDVLSNGEDGSDSLDTLKFKAGIKPEDILVSRGPGTITVWEPDMSWRLVPDTIILSIRDTGESIAIPNFHAARGLGEGRVDAVTFTDHPEVVWNADAVSRLALLGGTATDEIRGYVSDDVLRGNGGDDLLWGYRGNDAFQFGKDDGKDTLFEFANEGKDKVVFDQGIKPSEVVAVKSFEGHPAGMLVLRVTTGNTEIQDPNFFGTNEGIESVEFADGTVWNREYILANLQGGSGAIDSFVGTPGDDLYVVDKPQDSISEAVNGGIDSVQSSVSYVLPDNVENLTLTSMISGNLTGNILDNVLVGNGANNILDWGGGGLDTMVGGDGNDTYKIYAPIEYFYYFGDSYERNALETNIVELANEGVDNLQTNALYARLPDNVENLQVTAFMGKYFDRNSLVPPLAKYFGNSLDNVIDLGEIWGSGIPAELDGGAGNDTLIGTQDGEDRASYSSANAGVNVSLLISGPQDTGAGGVDTLRGIEGLVGSAFDDVLIGNSDKNVLDGGAGADRLIGGAGNDTYYVDNANDVVVEETDGGYRDVVYVTGLSDYTIPDNIEDVTINIGETGSAIVIGNDDDNSMQLTKNYYSTPTTALRGMGGNDYLVANFSGTELDGGSGNDLLVGFHYGASVFVGGEGNDTYQLDGVGTGDVIRANTVAVSGEVNTLRLNVGSSGVPEFGRENDDLVILTYGSVSLRIEKFFGLNGIPGDLSPVQSIVFDNGTILEFNDIKVLLGMENATPTVQHSLPDISTGEDAAWSYTLPADTFADADPGDQLTLSAQLPDGSVLPAWLSFDAASGTFTGTPPDAGALAVQVLATDRAGAQVSTPLNLTVMATATQPPTNVIHGTDASEVLKGTAGADTMHAGAGNDTLQGLGGDDALYGDAGDDILDGGAGNDILQGGLGNDTYLFDLGDDAGVVSTATDSEGNNTVELTGGELKDMALTGSASNWLLRYSQQDSVQLNGTFTVQWGGRSYSLAEYAQAIEDAKQPGTPPPVPDNHAPTVAQSLQDAAATQDLPLVLIIPQDTFADQDQNDKLTYSAALADGTALPAWLAFDAATRTLSGTPPGAAAGALQLRITATDLAGLSVSDDFALNIANAHANAAPTVQQSLPGISAEEDAAWSYTLPADTFADADPGDQLTLSAQLADGSALPAWLSFDAASGTFTGTPPDAGALALQVLATDRAGAQVSTPLNLTVMATATQPPTNVIHGTDASEVLKGTAGADTLYAGANDDTLRGMEGDDVLYGEDGEDTLRGGDGADKLYGGAGDDALYGDAGDDILDGGAGNDILQGGLGSDTYLFGRGDGQDMLKGQSDSAPGKLNTLRFKDNVAAADVQAERDGAALLLRIAGTSDSVRVENFFTNNTPTAPTNDKNPLQQVQFADGTVWDLTTLAQMSFTGNDTSETLKGTNDADTMHAGAGNDTLQGLGGDDLLYGEDGEDTLRAGDGADKLYGGAGDDALYGDAGDDILDGGAGNDILQGGLGSDTYLFGRGDGQDMLKGQSDSAPGKLNTLRFKDGVAAADVQVSRDGTALLLTIAATSDSVRVENYFTSNDPGNDSNPLQQVQFADGTVWDLAAITARATTGTDASEVIKGTIGADTIRAGADHDTLQGLGGDDLLYGDAGQDTLRAGDGADKLYGGADGDALYGDAGDDMLDGGAGNDTLQGGLGSDTYLFGRGDGVDRITENDSTVGNTDMLQFAAGVSTDQLWFRRVGSNLEVSIIGSGDTCTISQWYASDAHHVEQFTTSDGKVLLDSQVNNLVQAMAAFAPPAAGQTMLAADYQTALAPVMAANWR